MKLCVLPVPVRHFGAHTFFLHTKPSLTFIIVNSMLNRGDKKNMNMCFFFVFNRLLHTSHPFPCSECGESFKRRKELDLHSLTHQGENSGLRLACSVYPLFFFFVVIRSNLKLTTPVYKDHLD